MNVWTDLLRALTSDHPDDVPWSLVVEDPAKPAFLQPPDPGGLKWSRASTPDDLDILITARNHDIKRSVARESTAEDWLFALVSLQTSAGYDGKGNYGIARMNGGSSSRPMLGLVPSNKQDLRINPSLWWLRDVKQMLMERQSGDGVQIGPAGGFALLWCLDWPEGVQLDLRTLDPWFIEVCRRIRLQQTNAGLSAIRANSKGPRIDARMYSGNVGDPWAPVHKKEGKSLTLGSGDFDYRRLSDLMFGGDWAVPVLARLGPAEKPDERLLVAETLSRGNSKTEGFRSRIVPVPDEAVRFFRSPEVAALSQQLILEIREFDEALRNAIALLAAGGERERIDRAHYTLSHVTRRRFDQIADGLFFPHLWQRLAARNSGSSEAEDKAAESFYDQLFGAAKAELAAALPGIPCAAIHRPKAEARCWRAFYARAYRSRSHVNPTQEDQGDF